MCGSKNILYSTIFFANIIKHVYIRSPIITFQWKDQICSAGSHKMVEMTSMSSHWMCVSPSLGFEKEK